MTRTIKLKTVLPYGQDKVWQALTDPIYGIASHSKNKRGL